MKCQTFCLKSLDILMSLKLFVLAIFVCVYLDEKKRDLNKWKSLRVQQTVAAFNFPGLKIIWACLTNTVTAEEDIRDTRNKEMLDDEHLTIDENMSVEHLRVSVIWYHITDLAQITVRKVT